MTDDLVERLRAVAILTTYDVCRQAADRIEQLEAQADRLRAAMNDMVPYLSRADYYYMEPQTLEVLREINGGGNGR